MGLIWLRREHLQPRMQVDRASLKRTQLNAKSFERVKSEIANATRGLVAQPVAA